MGWKTRARRTALLAAAMSFGVGCGGVSFQYGNGQARTVAGLQNVIVAGAIDARANGTAHQAQSRPEVPLTVELQQMRRGTAEHLRRAGLPPGNTIAAPVNAAMVEGILQTAAQRGVPEVWFVRYHSAGFDQACFSTGILAFWLGILPWLILDSLPINAHAGVAGFEVIAVDVQSRDVLAQVGQVASYQEGVSAWGCGGEGIMREMMGRSLQVALERVDQERTAGYPNRQRGLNVGSHVMSAPAAYQVGNQAFGLGWSAEMPPGFTMTVSQFGGAFVATATTPDGASCAVTALPANVSNRDNRSGSAAAPPMVRSIIDEGHSVAMACTAVPGLMPRYAPLFERALSSLQTRFVSRR